MIKNELVDGLCWGDGVLSAARAWLSDCIHQDRSVTEGHGSLIGNIRELFESGSNAEVEAMISTLNNNGFEIGFDKVNNQVSISHPTKGFTLICGAR